MAVLGNRIKFYRKKYGISQAALAHYVGVSKKTVSRWEQGANLSAYHAMLLCIGLAIKFDDLFYYKDN